MSEVLNAEVTSSEEGGFSRRRVVKGVAWSVPVIVTAIAAPAAAASGVTEVYFPVPAAITLSGGNRPGTGPSGFTIKNTTGAQVTVSLSGSIIVTPTNAVHSTIAITAPAPSIFSTTTFNGKISTTTFTYAGVVPAGGTIHVPFGFRNTEDTGSNKPKKTDVDEYSLSMVLSNKPLSITGPTPSSLIVKYQV
ncbi:hypothetical protein [Pseudarthrobacter sulfonivorans]|uniref:hypothetical protein n=1 Tax=Pseudarthrobacter sulfonivorans TaxID=121292 RepID=UPI00168AAD69|nr:hypothetical protein [Pseudarthrobacter sulfonivorans]